MNRMRAAVPVLFVFWCLSCGSLRAWRLEFEVATVRPSLASEAFGQRGGPGTNDPRYYRATMPLRLFIEIAYELSPDEYLAPSWMLNQEYTVTAKVPAGANRSQLREMLQALLEERFKLKYHRTKKLVSAYNLVIAKGGPKLRPAAAEPPQPPKPSAPQFPTADWNKLDRDGFPIIPEHRGMRMVLVPGGARIRAYGQTMQQIAGMLRGQSGRRVADKTGLTGKYDYTLAFSTAASMGLPLAARGSETTVYEDLPTVNVFGAVQQQLGLRLEASKQVIEIMVIDSGEKVPIEN